jgi:hypothetical protein
MFVGLLIRRQVAGGFQLCFGFKICNLQAVYSLQHLKSTLRELPCCGSGGSNSQAVR